MKTSKSESPKMIVLCGAMWSIAQSFHVMCADTEWSCDMLRLMKIAGWELRPDARLLLPVLEPVQSWSVVEGNAAKIGLWLAGIQQRKEVCEGKGIEF